MGAKQAIGNNALKSSLVHDLLKRQVFLENKKNLQPIAKLAFQTPNVEYHLRGARQILRTSNCQFGLIGADARQLGSKFRQADKPN
jgi:hypothetical protein